MENICGSGGWMRVAYLNMSDSTEECPGFRPYQLGGVRACGRQSSNSGSCQSVKFPSFSISYSQVCGRIVGYQYGSSDAISSSSSRRTGYYNINNVDGISLTHGSTYLDIYSWTL